MEGSRVYYLACGGPVSTLEISGLTLSGAPPSQVVIFLGATVVLAFASISAQSSKPAAKPVATKKYAVPRTPWGDPDLQGIWPSIHMLGVPFQRPEQLAGKTVLSDQELKQREEQARRQAEQDNEEFVAPRA